MEKIGPWQQLSSKVEYQSSYLKVREDQVVRPDGRNDLYSVIELSSGVFIVPLTEQNETYLIKQFRYPTAMESWEVPAGAVSGKNILASAKRELKEETGLAASNWQRIGQFQTMNGSCNAISHVYLARQLQQTGRHQQEEEGITEVKKLPFDEVLAMIHTGQITCAQTIAALAIAQGFVAKPGTS